LLQYPVADQVRPHQKQTGRVCHKLEDGRFLRRNHGWAEFSIRDRGDDPGRYIIIAGGLKQGVKEIFGPGTSTDVIVEAIARTVQGKKLS